MTNHELLRVRPDADASEIKRAYRRRMKQAHPDLGGSEAEAVALARAYRALSDQTPDGFEAYEPRRARRGERLLRLLLTLSVLGGSLALGFR